MTDEDKKLIWEWCGVSVSYLSDMGIWVFSGVYQREARLDLNNLFKYAVPELYKRGYYYTILQWNEGQHKAIIDKKTVEWAVTASDAIDKDPAEAFGKALLQLIKENDNDR